MNPTKEELYDKVFKDIRNVYAVFQNYFGEDRVDLQGLPTLERFKSDILFNATLQEAKDAFRDFDYCIYVYWPRVTVTNENDRSVEIQKLFAEVKVSIEGSIPYSYCGFKLNRSEYTTTQWESNYMHSHISYIPKHNLTEFQMPCLGTGPIRKTILKLHNSNSEVTWMLFCRELDLYVSVESIAGKPYRYLESIGIGQALENDYTPPKYYAGCINNDKILNTLCGEGTFRKFVEYYLAEGHLKFSFANSTFFVGMPYFDYMVDISNSFIDFFNLHLKKTNVLKTQLFTHGILKSLIVSNCKFTRLENSDGGASISQYIGKKVLTFKGEDVLLEITSDPEAKEVHKSIILDHNIAMYILVNILKVINYRYKNEYNRKTHSTSTAQAGKDVCYL